jgi:hypothetical protein
MSLKVPDILQDHIGGAVLFENLNDLVEESASCFIEHPLLST